MLHVLLLPEKGVEDVVGQGVGDGVEGGGEGASELHDGEEIALEGLALGDRGKEGLDRKIKTSGGKGRGRRGNR